MSALLKEETRVDVRPVNRFPAEVYNAHDDVTPEAVRVIRERADERLAGKKWKKIDGVGKRNVI
uniref:Uncharacterized protein n=1 Tax=Agrobacterium albertimagni TaxID=147266 RepID=A0A7C1NVF2_9HYPH